MPDKPENVNPEIGFAEQGEHLGYQASSIAGNDVASIKIKTIKKGDGKLCQYNDWAKVNYKGYTGIEEPKKVFDSHPDQGGEGPKTFIVGHYEVSKCWDIAI